MKLLLIIATMIILFTIALYLYIFREQEIQLDLIPERFEYCNQTITTENKAYQEIFELLKHNKGGWVQSVASYIPEQTYMSEYFTVTVLKDALAISFKTESGYKQLVKSIDHELATNCH